MAGVPLQLGWRNTSVRSAPQKTPSATTAKPCKERCFGATTLHMVALWILFALTAYSAIGLLFAVPFALSGVKKIDPGATHGSWGFRLAILPGAMVFWPLLLKRWANGATEPPVACTAHCQATAKEPGR